MTEDKPIRIMTVSSEKGKVIFFDLYISDVICFVFCYDIYLSLGCYSLERNISLCRFSLLFNNVRAYASIYYF